MLSSKEKNKKIAREKHKLAKLIDNSDSEDSNSSEHELSHYINDRVKLMKEVLKIIKPKKIKSMAPHCVKHLDVEEINSMLLEELLGISNKRLRYIFKGEHLDGDSSSTDPEEEAVDIISLDDITDDDFVIEIDSDTPRSKKPKIKQEPKEKKIKSEKKVSLTNEKNLMSVLELLELQARARAIRSQLALESEKYTRTAKVAEDVSHDSDPEEVIIEDPKRDEIVISDSDTEAANTTSNCTSGKTLQQNNDKLQEQEVDKVDVKLKDKERNLEAPENKSASGSDKDSLVIKENNKTDKQSFEEDGIVINVDRAEMDTLL